MTNPPNYPEGSSGFDAYPTYASPEQPETPEWARTTPAVGTGKANVMDAVRWALKAVFASWYIWILGTLAIGLVIGVVAGVSFYFAGPDYSAMSDAEAVDYSMNANSVANGAVGLAQFFLTPFLLVGLLAQVTKRRISLADFFRNVPYFKVLGVSILQGILLVGTVLFLVVLLIVFSRFGHMIAPEATFIGLLCILGLLLAVWLLGPLFSLWTWYAADGHGVGESIKLGVAAGKRNYPQLLLFSFLSTLVILVGGLLTLGLGLLILTPACYLAIAHIYRQASGGQLPV
ncbi:hypothetical protein [Corynebacterium mastitidis]|uniref:hypothetical protein n=1 Tax=Corynebacterium mastitidis TaxID=161890 RepID=UPI00254D5D18|nr:hypothetical protein [Corynebacterium mastitidis]MDK8449754.1 hypothetical protein [Corynebacterium mastitidis]